MNDQGCNVLLIKKLFYHQKMTFFIPGGIFALKPTLLLFIEVLQLSFDQYYIGICFLHPFTSNYFYFIFKMHFFYAAYSCFLFSNSTISAFNWSIQTIYIHMSIEIIGYKSIILLFICYMSHLFFHFFLFSAFF